MMGLPTEQQPASMPEVKSRLSFAGNASVRPTTVSREKIGAVAWTPEEDEKLKAAVILHGGQKWSHIAALVPGRRSKQCRER